MSNKIKLDDKVIHQLIDVYSPNQNIRSDLFNHLKKVTYNPEYISQFTGKPIDKINIVKKYFVNLKKK